MPKLTEIGIKKAERLQTIEGTVPSPTDLPVGCHFAPRCEHRMEICLHGEIPFFQQPDGSQVRCLLYEEKIVQAA